MPTIAEIIAAKKAKQTDGTERKTIDGTERKTIDGIDYARNAMNPEWVAQGPASGEPMLDEAINRIDPPAAGKRRAGLVLSAKTPLQPAEVAQKAHHSELRSLSEMQGEAIPLTPCNASKEVETWHEALNAFESSLCVMRDPQDSDVVWLAIRPDREGLPPILINRLPWTLWDYPHAPTANQPF